MIEKTARINELKLIIEDVDQTVRAVNSAKDELTVIGEEIKKIESKLKMMWMSTSFLFYLLLLFHSLFVSAAFGSWFLGVISIQ